MSWLVLCLLGVSAGLASVFLGIGGGVFIVPVLALYIGLPLHQAVATSLAAIFIVTTSNTYLFHRDGQVNWNTALMIGPAAALSSFLAGLIAQEFPESYVKNTLIGLYIFLVFLLIYRYLYSRRKNAFVGKEHSILKKKIIGSLVGIVAGFLSGITGIGAGTVVGPVVMSFQLVKPEHYTPTINAVMAIATLSGAVSYMSGPWSGFQLGQVQIHYAVVLFFLAFFTSLLTRRYQSRLSENIRLAFLVVILLFLTSQLIFIKN